MKNTGKVSHSQIAGFNVAQVLAMGMALSVDSAGCWYGTQIDDKFLCSLREVSQVIGEASMKGAKDALLIVDGRKVFAFNVRVSGDTYERKWDSLTVRGSLKLLRKHYGEKAVIVGDLASLAKIAKLKKLDKESCAKAGFKRESIEAKAANTAKETAKAKSKAKSKD